MEDFVNYEIANKLKNLGFEESTYHYYNIDDIRYCRDDYPSDHNGDPLREFEISAPTISQVLKWLREEKNIFIEIFLYNGKYSHFIKSVAQICKDDLFHQCLDEDAADEEYATYEQAALAGIEYVLDNLI